MKSMPRTLVLYVIYHADDAQPAYTHAPRATGQAEPLNELSPVENFY